MLALPHQCAGTNWNVTPTSFPNHIFGEHRARTHRHAASQAGTKEGMEPVRGLLRALLLLLCVVNALSRMHSAWEGKSAMKSEDEEDETEKGTRWAVLIAGSSGYGNYRHQADVCHAYQILRRGGLKDENIVVFMYDDIASSEDNPYPGKIFNKPNGPEVYNGVPKDYTGSNVTVSNFYAAILGDKDAIVGGSGKVVASGPNDHIFIYYTDHGGPGCLGMPEDPILYADEFVDTLKKKAAAGTFKKMVIYLEACESGSIFDGLLPEGLNIYVTTASDPEENSWGTYCPGMENPPPKEFSTCLGDLYSVAWMEDTEIENLKKETLNSQYQIVKKRTSNYDTYMLGSHVMQYGDVKIDAEKVELYLGYDPANENVTEPEVPEAEVRGTSMHVPQREADLLHLWHKYYSEAEGSIRKVQAGMELTRTIAHRMHVDNSVKFIGELLFGHEAGQRTLQAVRPAGRVLVDDWVCLKSMVRAFEASCGPLTQYGMKHMRAFANICNAGIDTSAMATATSQACRISNMDSGIRTLDTSRFSTPL